MIKSKKGIVIALIFPIIVLAALVGYKVNILSIGKEITLPISGYDPRDLLAGHYLIYTVDYGIRGICSGHSGVRTAHVCLRPKKFTYQLPENCELMIKGFCRGSQFNAGIERYYVPEKDALRLENLVQSGEASIVLSVSRSGNAQIKDLLINGKSWKDQ